MLYFKIELELVLQILWNCFKQYFQVLQGLLKQIFFDNFHTVTSTGLEKYDLVSFTFLYQIQLK